MSGSGDMRSRGFRGGHDGARALTLALALGVVVGLTAAGGGARAEDPRGYDAVAVQNRGYFGHHELGLAVGILPMDAFTKGFTLSAAYTLHFDPVYAWEIAQLTYAIPVDTGLKADLSAYDLQPTPFEVLETSVFTNFVLTPIYWKGAVFNDSLTRGEIMLLLGAGYGWFTRSSRPGFDAGLAMRLFMSEHVSLRLDVRYQGFLTTSDVDGALDLHSDLWIGLGLGFIL